MTADPNAPLGTLFDRFGAHAYTPPARELMPLLTEAGAFHQRILPVSGMPGYHVDIAAKVVYRGGVKIPLRDSAQGPWTTVGRGGGGFGAREVTLQELIGATRASDNETWHPVGNPRSRLWISNCGRVLDRRTKKLAPTYLLPRGPGQADEPKANVGLRFGNLISVTELMAVAFLGIPPVPSRAALKSGWLIFPENLVWQPVRDEFHCMHGFAETHRQVLISLTEPWPKPPRPKYKAPKKPPKKPGRKPVDWRKQLRQAVAHPQPQTSGV